MGVHEWIAGVVDWLVGDAVGFRIGAPSRCAPLVANNVSGQGIKPGPLRADLWIEYLWIAPGSQDRLLYHVLRLASVAGQSQRVTPERAGVLLVQLTQQVRVVAARAPARQVALADVCAALWLAPLPFASPLLSAHTHRGCASFTGICSVSDRATWFARASDRIASRSRRRRVGAPNRRPTVIRSARAGVTR